MSGFATHLVRPHLKREHHAHRDYTAATSERWRVIRHDGVVLGGATSREVAERLRNVLCQGQRADFACVIKRGGES